MDDDDLTKAILQHLADDHVGVYRADGSVYPDGEIALMYGALEPKPDQAVGVTVYNGVDEPGAEQLRTERFVQFRIRGTKTDRGAHNKTAGAVKASMQNLSRVSGILSADRVSFTPVGVDGVGRPARTDNYSIIFDNQET